MKDLASRIEQMIQGRLTLILTESDVRKLLAMDACIEMQDLAFKEFTAGKAVAPQRPRIRIPEFHGNSSYMPGYVPAVGGLGCKIVSGYHRNHERGLPSTMGSLVLLDARTGFPLAYMGSTFLTNARTAAAAGSAGRVLIRKDARTVGVFGSGALARLTLEAVHCVMAVGPVTVYSRRAENRTAYAAEMRARFGLDVQAVDDPAIPAAADVIVVATTSAQPVFDGQWVRPGMTLLSVGSGRPDLAEFPASVIKGHKFVVESRASALKEVGELIIPMQAGELTEDAIHGELGEILLGRLPGRVSPNEIIVFKSTGLAVQDIITARAVYLAALERGMGQAIAVQAEPA